jgi:hypothetical protein
MKSTAAFLVLLMAASASAFVPPMATRVTSAKPAVAKKVEVKKTAVAAKPAVKASVVKGAVKPVASKKTTPAFTLPSLKGKIPQKPKITVSAPSTSRTKKNVDYVFDDGLTVLERRQRGTPTATFLTGSANSRAVKSAIRDDIAVGDEYFLSPYDTSIAVVFFFTLISLIIKAGSP